MKEFPASLTSSLSPGYDQVVIDGVTQDEARLPNKGTGTLMVPMTASVTVTNASVGTNPNTISSTTFGSKATNFLPGDGEPLQWQKSLHWSVTRSKARHAEGHIEGFELARADETFHPASAKIEARKSSSTTRNLSQTTP